jgi:stalled ribosome rescue protein Dom34
MSADTEVGDLTDVGVAKRGGTYSGVRGQTGTDAARRFLDQGVDRMLKALMDELIVRVDGSGLLVVGGTPETVAAIMSQAPPWLAERTLPQPSLHIGMSMAEVQRAAEDSASILTGHLQQKLLDQVIDLARSGARGCLGPESTEAALLGGRVDALLLSRRYIHENADRADWCVGSAFSQGADVEEVSLDVADQLDREGGGIGARLRFVVAAVPGSALAGP